MNKQREFALCLSNKFQSLQVPESDVQQHYDTIETSITEAAQETLGILPRKRKKNWVSAETLCLIDKRNVTKRRYQQKKSPASRDKWRELAKQVSASYTRDEKRYIEKQTDELKEAERNHTPKKTWKIVNELSGKADINPASQVKAPDGKIPDSAEALMDEWKKYFSSLLNAPPVTQSRDIPPADEDLPIDSGDFTLSEMNKTIDAFKNLNKAPGVDYSVTVEAIKYGGTDLTNQLLILCNNVKRRRISPRQWRPNLVVPIPKKGDKTKMGNYRGISLMSIAGKLYNRLLLNRIRGPVEAVLLNTQAGFRPGRSCIEHIHVLRRILEGCKDKNIPIIASYVDFKKAFDLIDRDQMFKILRHYGIPDDIVQSIAVLYSIHRVLSLSTVYSLTCLMSSLVSFKATYSPHSFL